MSETPETQVSLASTHMAASGPLTGWAHRTYGPFASAITLVGAVVMILGSLLAWTYDASYADNLTINFSPIGGQRWAIGGALLIVLFVLTDSILWPAAARRPARGRRARLAGHVLGDALARRRRSRSARRTSWVAWPTSTPVSG